MPEETTTNNETEATPTEEFYKLLTKKKLTKEKAAFQKIENIYNCMEESGVIKTIYPGTPDKALKPIIAQWAARLYELGLMG
jgi:hypothetical protein